MAVAQSAVSWPSTRMPALADRGRQATDVGGDDRGAAGLRLDGDQPERLVVRGHGEHVGRAVPLGQGRPVDRRHEAHQVADAELLGELGQPHRVAHAGAAGPAEDGDDEPRAQVGAAAHQLGGGLDEHVGRLERLDAADEQEEHGIRGDADGGPRLALRRRGVKTARSTPGSATTTRSGSAS